MLYRDDAEFRRVLAALEKRAAAIPSNADSRFVLAVQRYYTGDARCMARFAWLAANVPDDRESAAFAAAAAKRFGTPEKPEKKGEKK